MPATFFLEGHRGIEDGLPVTRPAREGSGLIVGRIHGVPHGIILKPPGRLHAPQWTVELRQLHHIATVQSVLVTNALMWASGWSPKEVPERVMNDLGDAPFEEDSISIDGRRYLASLVTYGSISMLLSDDLDDYPVAIVRPRHVDEEWPHVRTNL